MIKKDLKKTIERAKKTQQIEKLLRDKQLTLLEAELELSKL